MTCYLIKRNGRYLSDLFADTSIDMFGTTSTDVSKAFAYGDKAIAERVANELGAIIVASVRRGTRYEVTQ